MSSNNLIQKFGNVAVILGAQWGDEGKGKLIDIMSEQYNIIARATGGANAGHTVYIPNPENENEPKKFAFHLIPSGMLYPNTVGVIGNGCVVHLPTLLGEIELLEKSNINVDDRLFISSRAQMVLEYHIIVDGIQEEQKGKDKVGTTKRGIGPAYTDKVSRTGIRFCDLLDFEIFEKKLRTNVKRLQDLYKFDYDIEKEINLYKEILPKFKSRIIDTSYYLNNAHKEGKNILIEGANGTLLDIDHGTYPYCTSSNASVGGVVCGTGIAANKLDSVIGIMKAYMTRVGAGPFPTEEDNEVGEKLRKNGGEFGTTTGRPRRCGWFDTVASKYSATLNGLTHINLTKLDVMDDFETVKIGVSYTYKGEKLKSFPAVSDILDKVEIEYEEMPGWQEDISGARTISDLPQNAQNYVKRIEELMEVPVDFVGVGVSREQMASNI